MAQPRFDLGPAALAHVRIEAARFLQEFTNRLSELGWSERIRQELASSAHTIELAGLGDLAQTVLAIVAVVEVAMQQGVAINGELATCLVQGLERVKRDLERPRTALPVSGVIAELRGNYVKLAEAGRGNSELLARGATRLMAWLNGRRHDVAAAQRLSAVDELHRACDAWQGFCEGQQPQLLNVFVATLRKLGPQLPALEPRFVALADWFGAPGCKVDALLAIEIAVALRIVDYHLHDPETDSQSARMREATISTLLKAAPRTRPTAIPPARQLAGLLHEIKLLERACGELTVSLSVVETAISDYLRGSIKPERLSEVATELRRLACFAMVIDTPAVANVLRECGDLVREWATDASTPSDASIERVSLRLAQASLALRVVPFNLASATAKQGAAMAPRARVVPSNPMPAVRSVAQQEIEPKSQPAAGRDAVARPNAACVDAAEVAEATPMGEEAPPQPAFDAGFTPSAEPESEAFDDEELFAIFIEEASEVLAQVGTCAAAQFDTPDVDNLVEIRRGFHTLKGSGRMVGLNRLADAAERVESCISNWIDAGTDGGPALLHASGLFEAWVMALGEGVDPNHVPPALQSILHDLRATPAAMAAPRVADRSDGPAAVADACGANVAQAATQPATEGTLYVAGVEISAQLFEAFLREAGRHVALLHSGVGRLTVASEIPQAMLVAAHTLAGSAKTARFLPLARLAEALGQVLHPCDSDAQRLDERALGAIVAAVERLKAMVEGLPGAQTLSEDPALLESLAACASIALGNEPERAPQPPRDEVDPQLLPLFLEEAQELVPQLGAALRRWRENASDSDAAREVSRHLHTFKGTARMAGAFTAGALAHQMESDLQARGASAIDDLDLAFDRMQGQLDALGAGRSARGGQQARASNDDAPGSATSGQPTVRRTTLRARAEVIERLVGQAGEIGIARSRIEGGVRVLRGSLGDLSDNVARLRNQLREVEIQAEARLMSEPALNPEDSGFDPLEFDRFTRFQELTRMMSESVNDIGVVQQNLNRHLEETDGALVLQARVTRDLQQSLTNIRMASLATVSDRLHRVVRQTAKELGKRSSFELTGATVELDRSALDRLVPALEHLLRNALAHGIEERAARLAAGKPEVGVISLGAQKDGADIVLVLSDDGCGLDLPAIRARALECGLLAAGAKADDKALGEFIFSAGFSTASQVSSVAGRGVGLDVVKSEISALGGRVEIASEAGRGARFTITLPVSSALTHALLVRADGRVYALPAVMVEQVQAVEPAALRAWLGNAAATWHGREYPFYYLPHLLGETLNRPESDRRTRVLLLRSGGHRAAVQVDEVLGNQEIVVKNTGPQVARISGIAGATVLADGQVVLILNPILLAQREQRMQRATPIRTQASPLVMVVDDSLTVRRVTARFLSRHGYRVISAKDGVDAIEKLRDGLPDVILLDIEMPRMDGYDLTRHLRADAATAEVPIVMISSRFVEKHHQHAMDLGVNVFLGKPYQEDVLLECIEAFASRATVHGESVSDSAALMPTT